MLPPYLRKSGRGLLLGVRVTPKSSANAIAGLYEAGNGAVSLQVRVTAQPEKGKANKAVIQTLAKALGVPKSNLTLVSGETARQKTVHSEEDPEGSVQRIDELLRAQQS